MEEEQEGRNGTLFLRRKKADSKENKAKSQKRKRKNLEKEQVEILERAFIENTHPSKEEKEKLSQKVGLSYSKVMKWFDNRRSKMRNSSTPNEIRQMKKTKVDLPKKEPWETHLDQRVHSLKASGYISGRKHEHNVRAQFIQWLEFMKYRKDKQKKLKKKPKKHKEELFQEFSTEVQRLLSSITFECETILYQGDGTSTNANISICNFCFSIEDKEIGTELNQFPPHKGDVSVTAVHDSRATGLQDSASAVATEKIKFKFFKCGHFGEKLSIGVKAVGTPAELLEGEELDYAAWGDIVKLKEWLHTSLSQAELVAFLFFCTQWKLNAKWFVNCMREKMFPDEDSDYHSESEEFDVDDYGDDDDDSDGLD